MNKIMIVDDSTLMLHTARDTLLRHFEIPAEISLCHSGEEALTLLKTETFDIVLLDIVMPQLSGIDVLHALHARNFMETSKVIMFSSITDKKALKECFSLGATDYITKPIEEDEFIARITNALNEQNLKSRYRSTINLMKKQNDKLTNLYQQLADAEYQLIQQEQRAGVGHLAAGVAHEINTPIGYIKSNLSSMNQYIKSLLTYVDQYEHKFGPIDPQEVKTSINLSFIREDADQVYIEIQQGIHRIEAIVNSLRSFSNIDNANDFSELELSKTLDDILQLLSTEIGDTIGIERNYSPVDVIVVNNSEVHLALFNIIQNALYAVQIDDKPQKRVRLTIDDDAKYIYCHIWDNGVGISDENISNIFNTFYTTKPVGSGRGLGLSMAYDIIVNKYKGRLEVISKLGEWTNFSIAFPKECCL